MARASAAVEPVVEQCWTLLGARRGRVWLCRRDRHVNGERTRVEFDGAWALKREETRYRHTTDGGWLSEREDYYKALTESLYRERRSRLIETLFLWWADVLRAKIAKVERLLESCAKATEKLAGQLNTAAVLKRVRRLEEMRDQLNTNAQEALVLEVGCLHIFR